MTKTRSKKRNRRTIRGGFGVIPIVITGVGVAVLAAAARWMDIQNAKPPEPGTYNI